MCSVNSADAPSSLEETTSIAPESKLDEIEGLKAAGSCACDGVDILHALRQPVFMPGGAAVLRAEYLPAARDAIDLRRVRRVHVGRHHRGVRFHAMIEALPRFSRVIAAIERAVAAARRRRKTCIHDSR